jgi:PEP-CTERM motif
MIHAPLRKLAVVLAVSAVASTASAAVFQYQFQRYYDGATLNPLDTQVFSSVVAGLTVTDITGGAQISLKFKDTVLPDASSTKKMALDRLWLSGPTGTVSKSSGDSFTSTNYSFLGTGIPDNIFERRSTLIDYNTSFTEGETSVLTIKGTGVSAGSLLSKAPVIEIDNVGGNYGKWTGKSVRFIGALAPIPEPSTYALMGLGLVGVVLAARKRQAA